MSYVSDQKILQAFYFLDYSIIVISLYWWIIWFNSQMTSQEAEVGQ